MSTTIISYPSTNATTSGGGIVQYDLNGVTTTVNEDTGTPANNAPLPVHLVDASGNTNKVAATQSGTWNITNVSGTVSLPTGASTETTLAAASAKLPATLGQKAMTASMAVALASDQSSIPVAATQSGAFNITNVSGTVSLPTGAATETTLAAASAKLPAALGQTTMAASMSVAIASNQSNLPVVQQGLAKADLARNDYSSVNVTTAAYVTLIASTAAAAKGLFIFDSSGQTLFLAFGAAASEINQIYVVPGGNGWVDLAIPASTRISLKAVSATASTGEINVSLLG